jgi:hypothetical protein
MVELSQYRRSYKVFRGDFLPPFDLVRTLSTGDLIGKCYEEIENALTLDEVRLHIDYRHIEPELEK